MSYVIIPISKIIHPNVILPININDSKVISALEESNNAKLPIILAVEKIYKKGVFYNFGTVANILSFTKNTDYTATIDIQTTSVAELTNVNKENDVYRADASIIQIQDKTDDELNIQLRKKMFDSLLTSASTNKNINKEEIKRMGVDYPLPIFIDFILSVLSSDMDFCVLVLSQKSWKDKMILLLEKLKLFAEMSQIEDKINKKVFAQLEESKRDFLLQEKIRMLQREVGDSEEEKENDNFYKKIESTLLSNDAKEKAFSELKKIRRMPPMSPDVGLIKNYLDVLLSLPWGIVSKRKIDLTKAKEILDENHFGMFEVKQRILEHIAVMKKTKSQSGSILCLVGAPGVGKTSLAKSIADALGRSYQRLSLGGVSDEAFFRGHRRTYIGSQPGRIIDALIKAKTMNPVIVLDEIDKLGSFGRGDPESALLEILDPEQNKTFRDHFVEVDFDLSKVLFIATSNSLKLSSALKDRMEIIEIAPYSDEEKIQIAKRYLIRKSAFDTGYDVNNIVIDEDSIAYLINKFTNEEGVRELKRVLTSLLRRSLLENNGNDIFVELNKNKIDSLLNVKKMTYGKKIGFSERF